MTYNPNIHKRKSIRLNQYNYSKEGIYFITICIQNRECLLSKIKNVGPAPTLGDIICSFKTTTTLEYIKGVKEGRYKSFNKRIWQRNYYEHIVRNEREYNMICNYIENNPLNWKKDNDNIYKSE